MQLAYDMLSDVTDAYVVADSAYDAGPLAKDLETRRCAVVIPSNPTRATLRDFDRHLYRERFLAEQFFQRIKRFRRISMRFEKLARNFLAFVQLAAVLVWLL